MLRNDYLSLRKILYFDFAQFKSGLREYKQVTILSLKRNLIPCVNFQ